MCERTSQKEEAYHFGAPLVRPNSPLLAATQKILHEDCVAGREAALKIELSKKWDIYEIPLSPLFLVGENQLET